jgi:uncharacterized protein (DUF983 family)
MDRELMLLWRGLVLRCPVCGKGKVFRRWFKMYEQCPVCHFVYEREEGYFSGALALNLVVSELLLTVTVAPVAAMVGLNPSIPLLPVLLLCAPLPIVLPLLFYRHCRTVWMSMDHMWHPVEEDIHNQDVPSDTHFIW